MFRLTNLQNGKIYDTDAPLFVKQNPNTGSWIQCHEDDAQCVVVDGFLFNICGKSPSFSAQDTVSISEIKIDVAAELQKLSNEVKLLSDKVFGDKGAG